MTGLLRSGSSLLRAKVDEFTVVRSGPPIDRTLLAMTAAIRTPDQRLRVFVSSTLAEMAEERAAVARAITGLQLTPVKRSPEFDDLSL